MKWIYWGKLYETKFQAGCLVRRMENDWWVYGYECPKKSKYSGRAKGDLAFDSSLRILRLD
ncbi:hypothetical protein [Paenibacillus albus]|uniref:hypothetical protein n=1 Tax=Paenibacillus albus TaxID=2495582 RepID=UPI0013DED709|nr:hypothetical protein [Paenibacillus albus]